MADAPHDSGSRSAEGKTNLGLSIIGALTTWAGSVWAILVALFIILVWAVSGPLFGFSDTWQLIINTFTTLVTFVMVFVIQNTQNRDERALHVKLDEVLVALKGADSALAGLEDLPEKQIKRLQDHVREAAHVAAEETTGKMSEQVRDTVAEQLRESGSDERAG
jgi:low affinity Fe/Cu permease